MPSNEPRDLTRPPELGFTRTPSEDDPRRDPHLLAAIETIAPGTPLRQAVDDVIRSHEGALIVIGDPAELRSLVGEAGLDGAEVDDVLAGDAYNDRVIGLTQQAVSIGITGVPGFLLDRRLLVLGAQPRGVFERAFEQLSEAPPGP